MRRRTARRTAVTAIAVTAALLSGCGGGDPPGSPAASATPSAVSASPVDASSAGSSSGASAAASAAPVVLLSERELPPMKGYSYARIGPDQVPEAIARANAVVTGFLVRELKHGSAPVGTVEVIRLADSLTEPQMDELLPEVVNGYSQQAPAQGQTLAGRPVLVVDRTRGQRLGTVAFRRDREITLISVTPDGAAAKAVASLYLSG